MISSSYPHFSALWNRECLKRAVSTSSPICPSKHFNLVLIQPSTETVKTPMTSTLTEQMDTFQFFFSGSTSRIGHIWLFSLSSCALFFLFLWHLSFVFPLFFFVCSFSGPFAVSSLTTLQIPHNFGFLSRKPGWVGGAAYTRWYMLFTHFLVLSEGWKDLGFYKLLANPA